MTLMELVVFIGVCAVLGVVGSLLWPHFGVLFGLVPALSILLVLLYGIFRYGL